MNFKNQFIRVHNRIMTSWHQHSLYIYSHIAFKLEKDNRFYHEYYPRFLKNVSILLLRVCKMLSILLLRVCIKTMQEKYSARPFPARWLYRWDIGIWYFCSLLPLESVSIIVLNIIKTISDNMINGTKSTSDWVKRLKYISYLSHTLKLFHHNERILKVCWAGPELIWKG